MPEKPPIPNFDHEREERLMKIWHKQGVIVETNEDGSVKHLIRFKNPTTLRKVAAINVRAANNFLEILTQDKEEPLRAPVNFERLLALIAPHDRQEEVLGDFEENLQIVAARQGPRFAKLWYGCQVVTYGLNRLIAAALKISGLWKRA